MRCTMHGGRIIQSLARYALPVISCDCRLGTLRSRKALRIGLVGVLETKGFHELAIRCEWVRDVFVVAGHYEMHVRHATSLPL